ncbi:hypothetical protein GKE73_15955 [Paludibacterium sp. dN 18-1]|uniref:Uncharacterized protein n=2 Tax=Paludibacterium denitrificans TaxID=2675226 RepID=A0A844GE62_9NEIS|nr:hypothetical protein [Paludibacterium denitrificans]
MMATVLPNDAYSPLTHAISGRSIYLDGWETTLAADWTPNGMSSPVLTDWIGLDTQLKMLSGTTATVVIEWDSEDGTTYRRPFSLYAAGDVIRWGDMPDMATGAVSDASMTIPSGSRVYLPLMAADMQLLANRSPECITYVINNGTWACIGGFSPYMMNPDGSGFQLLKQ